MKKASLLISRLLVLAALIAGMLLLAFRPSPAGAREPRVLIFSKTNGYHHQSIEAGIAAIKKLGAENGFLVDATTDSTRFNKTNLKKYAAVIFLSPTGKILGKKEEEAFQQYIEKGGGFVGIHAAADCEYNWPWYGKMLGAWFLSHPKQQQAKLAVVDKKHASTATLPRIWDRYDEWYNYRNYNPDIEVLIRIDESSYTGGANGAFHPIAWYHSVGRGRVFYTGLGHTEESYTDPVFLTHIMGGIHYALGLDE